MKSSMSLAAALFAAGLGALAPAAHAAGAQTLPATVEGSPAALDAPRQRALYLGIIESLRKEGSARAALAHLDSYDQSYPHDAKAQILRADCLADIGDSAAAEALYRKAATGAFADQAEAGLGHLMARRRDWAAAAIAFGEAVRRKPTEVAYLNDLGFALLQQGRSDDGLFRLRQALELAPEQPLARNNLIIGLKKAGRSAEADALVTAIRDANDRASVRNMLDAAASGDAQ